MSSYAWHLISAAPQAHPSISTPRGRPGRQTLAGNTKLSAEVFSIDLHRQVTLCRAAGVCTGSPIQSVCMRQQQGKQSKQLCAALRRLLAGPHGCAIYSCIRGGASHLQVQTARHRGHQPLLNLTMLA